MKALVTGGGGFVGLAVVRMLVERGIDVSIIGRNKYTAVEELGVPIFQGDIRNIEFVTKALNGVDIVFHVAAKAGIWGRREDFFSINVDGTQNILDACRINKVKALVYTSTPSVVFNGSDIVEGNEDLPYATSYTCYYASSKIVAERNVLAVNSDDFQTCALRPHLVWGPGDPHLIPRLLERGSKGQLRQVGEGKNLVDISYIDNVAEAHLFAMDNLMSTGSAAGKPYFISQGNPVNLWKWINDILKRFEIDPVNRKVSLSRALTIGKILEAFYGILRIKTEPRMTRFLAEQLAMSHWFSIARAETDLGYKPSISTEEGEERLVTAFRK